MKSCVGSSNCRKQLRRWGEKRGKGRGPQTEPQHQNASFLVKENMPPASQSSHTAQRTKVNI